MTVPPGGQEMLAAALGCAHRARLEIVAALDRLTVAGSGAWEGRQAERWFGRMRRLAAEATDLADQCVHAVEAALAARSAAAPGPPAAPPPSTPMPRPVG